MTFMALHGSSEFAIRKYYRRICNPTPSLYKRIENPAIRIRQCNCRIAQMQLSNSTNSTMQLSNSTMQLSNSTMQLSNSTIAIVE